MLDLNMAPIKRGRALLSSELASEKYIEDVVTKYVEYL